MQKVYVQPRERNLWALWAAEKPGRHWASCRIVAKQWQGGWLWQLTTLQGFDRIRTYMWCQSFSTCHFQFVWLGEDIRPQWHLKCSCQCHSTKDTEEQSVGGCTQALELPGETGHRWLWDVLSSERQSPQSGLRGEAKPWLQTLFQGSEEQEWACSTKVRTPGMDLSSY